MISKTVAGIRCLAVAAAFLAIAAIPAETFAQEAEPRASGLLESVFNAIFSQQAGSDSVSTESAGESAMVEEAEELAKDASLPRSDQRIDLREDLDEALKLSQLEQRPLLVILGAEWCTWCRKLEHEIQAEEADPILKRWIVVTVDVDAAPSLAEEFRAAALPSLRILGSDRKVVGSREGYMPLVELQQWLDSAMETADPAVQRVLYETTELAGDDIQQLVEFLGNRSPSIRLAAQKRLITVRESAAGAVVDVLRSGRLAQQLSALDILRDWQAPVEAIDPWQPATLEAPAVEPLLQWLRSQGESPGRDELAEKANAPDAKVLRELIFRVLTENDERRSGLMIEAESVGEALLPELRARLANSSELADAQRVLLRELQFRILSGPKLRLENPSIFAALASLNAETHRKAAERVLNAATSQDEPLISELSQDADPLVRELSVAALQSTGALRSPDLLRRLLADKSPSVRTAVLRELSEKPQDESIELLIEYVAQETDEDLLVYTTKALAQLGTHAGAEQALCTLVQNASWRVRAAALDAIGQMLEKSQIYIGIGSYGGMGGVSSAISQEIAQSVLNATEDSDSFVVERAVALLPKLISPKTAETLVTFLSDHPERLHLFEKQTAPQLPEQPYDPLIAVALKRLESEDTATVRGAALIISRLKPSVLREHLVKMLESPDEITRIAALDATVASVAALRDEQLQAALPFWQAGESTIEPWLELPERFRSLPDLPTQNSAREEETNSAESEGTSTASNDSPSAAGERSAEKLNALDDLFGGSTEPAEPLALDETSHAASNSIAAKPAQDAVSAEEPGTPAEALDHLSEFFGSVPSAQENLTADAPVSVGAGTGSSTASTLSERPVLASQWLNRWFETAENEQPEWLQTTRRLLKERLGAEPAKRLVEPKPELHWLAAASLAAGNEELAPLIASAPIMERHDATGTAVPRQSSLPDLAVLLPWLPPAERLEKLQTIEIDWAAQQSASTTKLLKSATTIDDQAVARWIFDGATRQPLEPAQFAFAQRFLSRALLGQRSESAAQWTDEESLTAEEISSRFEQASPGAPTALQWLTERFQFSNRAAQKAMLLSAASHIDHRLAVHSAVGMIEQATEFDQAIQIAAIVALADKAEASVDRAVQWLQHPLPQIRSMALKRLTTSSSDFAGEFHEYGTMLIMKHDDPSPGLWLARRPIPSEDVKKLADAEPSAEWPAALLLVAAGEPSLERLASDDQSKESLMKIVTALVKAKRSDEAALAYYRRAVAELDEYNQPAQLYRLLLTLDGDEVAAIRRELRTLRGSEILN